MTHSPGEAHMSDEALLRYLDGEVTGEMRRTVRLHLRSCPTCLRRAREIRTLSGDLDGMLGHLDLEPSASLLPRTFKEVQLRRGQRRVSPGVPVRQAAAILLVLMAGALAASPLRARVLDWVSDRVAEAAHVLGIAPRAAPSTPRAIRPDAAAGEPSEFAFVPDGPELGLILSYRQAAGTLQIARGSEQSAVFRVLDPDTARAAVLVLPNAIQVRNSAASHSSYQLVVPPATRSVRVTVGAGAAVEVRLDSLGSGGVRSIPVHPVAGETGP